MANTRPSTEVAVDREASSLATDLASKTAIVIVAYNSGAALEKCLASVRRTAPAAQVVLVDNASTDASADRASGSYPEVRLIRSDANIGFGAGNNLGAAHSDREFLVFINPDTVVLDGWLEAMLRPMADDPTIGLVTPKVLLQSDPSLINVAGLDVHLSGISMCRGAGESKEGFDRAEEVAAVSGVAFAARRAVYEALGGFDPAFFLYMEDVDLSLRARLGGYRCLYVPDPVVLHEYEMRLDPQKTFYVERGRYLMLLKSFSARTLFALLPILLLAEVITWGWVFLLRPSAAGQKAKAASWVVRHWDEIMEARRKVQTRRSVPDAHVLVHISVSLAYSQLAGQRLARVAAWIWNPMPLFAPKYSAVTEAFTPSTMPTLSAAARKGLR